MSKHSFIDNDGDTFTAEVVPDIPSLIDIRMGEAPGPSVEYDSNLITIRVDAAEDIARIILEAAKETRA